MNILFLTVVDITDINARGIYQDLLRKFSREGHDVFIVSPVERRRQLPTSIKRQSNNTTILNIKILNIQKTNVVEKGMSTLLIERQFLKGVKKYFRNVRFDLVLYSTPPITFTKVVQFIKKRDGALSYLLLKDIFPQNAVDLGMIKKGGVLHRFFVKKEHQLYEASDYIGCMSEANMNYVVTHNPQIEPARVEVNPNSIELTEEVKHIPKESVRKNYNIPEDALVFIYGGNLGKPQGIDFLLQVLKNWKNHERAFFIIAGSGTEFPKLENWYNQANPRNICLFKSLPKTDYDQLVAACDIGMIFLNSRFTIPNFPSRLLSYLENNIPVLCATDRNTDIGTIVEKAGAGLSTVSDNIAAFTEKMNYLLNLNRQQIKEMGDAAYKLLVTEYLVDISYSKIRQKFDN